MASRGTPTGAGTSVSGELAYVLHSYPYRETSLVVEAFTPGHGRVGLVAKGARRPGSALRGVLLAFQPLLLSFTGRSELKTLTRAEWDGGYRPLTGRGLLCGFYLNELLLKLLGRDDPHEGLFAAYHQALAALRQGEVQAGALRRFEKALLRELGYGIMLDHDTMGRPLDPQGSYVYRIEQGPVALGPAEGAGELVLAGKTLLDLHAECYDDPVSLVQGRSLMRAVLGHYLDGQVLHTRQLLLELQLVGERAPMDQGTTGAE